MSLLVTALLLPACGTTGSPGGSNPNGILWNSQATPGGGAPGAPTPGWIDPNLGVSGPIGIQNIIVSTDDATYDSFDPNGQGLSGIGPVQTTSIQYIAGLFHPLSTDTGSISVTSREDTLQGEINGYRQQKLGGIGAGGGNFNGGIIIGNTTGVILAGHFEATKSARAHCKHYALFHGGFPPGENAEGDDLQVTVAGTPAFTPGTPQLEPLISPPVAEMGRLGKLDVTAQPPVVTGGDPTIIAGGSIVYSGGAFDEADPVFARLVLDVPNVITDPGWTNFAVGHWRGGPNVFYWNIIFLSNPNPAN
ncbi:MAG TPA: hypothetical protein VKU80_18245 [Planctomycetota bacterium]|nr:hypothetical protein [Planctomycetota bacterium]